MTCHNNMNRYTVYIYMQFDYPYVCANDDDLFKVLHVIFGKCCLYAAIWFVCTVPYAK